METKGGRMNQEQIEQWTREAGGFDATREFMRRFAEQAMKAEREACAQVAEKYGYDNFCGRTTDPIAVAIRARGQL